MSISQYFAQDILMVSDIAEALTELIGSQPELHWAALIDGAFDYPRSLESPYAAAGLNCYGFDLFEGLDVAAPWLVPLNSANPQLLQSLLRHCQGRPMISFVASRLPIPELPLRWSTLHWVQTDDEQRMLLRVADTRILPVLAQVLTPEQWAAFTVHLDCWHFIGRSGHLTACPLAPKNAIASNHLRLTQNQLDMLLQAAEPDAVVDMLTENMKDIIPANMKKSEFYNLISESCVLGQQHAVDTFSDTVSLAVAACLTRGQSNSDAKLKNLLISKPWKPGTLGDAIVAQGII